MASPTGHSPPILVGSSYDSGINQLPCNLVNNFTNSWEQCSFVIQNDCLEEDGLDYVYFNYCIMGTKLRYVSILIIVFLLIVLFLTLSTIADEFLCPCLLTIAKNLRMSENLAGVTLLAFGNGSSDIFSSLAAASSGKSELIVSELLGAGIFCLSIVAGLIFIRQDFRLAYRPLLRDTIFYLFAVYFTWFVCWSQQITFYYALAFILIYVIYLTVALGGQAIYLHLQQKQKHRQHDSMANKLATISVKIDDCESGGQGQNDSNDKTKQQDCDWSYGSDWFVQSHDSIRRRRLSKSKLMTQEERALLQENSAGLCGEHKKYGGLNHHIKTNIKIDSSTIDNNRADACGGKENNDVHLNVAVGYDPKLINGLEKELRIKANNNYKNRVEESKMKNCSLNNNVGYTNPIFNENTTTPENLKPDKDADGVISSKNEKGDEIATNKDLEDKNFQNNVMLKFQSPGKCAYSNGFNAADNDPNYDQNSISFNEWDDLLSHVNPIYLSEWSDANLIRKVITIIRSPLVFIALCTIPVVDHDKKRNNWCRLLNTFHCISIPTVIFLSRELANYSESKASSPAPPPAASSTGIDLASLIVTYHPLLLLAIGLILAVFMLKTTQSDKPPKYHMVFAYVGFIMSILWVYSIVTEILGLLKTIGIIFSMSDTTIGLAFLAWGNSLGDIVANLALADAGYPRMAIGACIGAPLLNLLIGFGLSFAINLAPDEVATIEYTPTITLLCMSLGIVILSLMLCTLVPPHHSKRPFGFVLISAYFIYFVLAISLEFKLLVFD